MSERKVRFFSQGVPLSAILGLPDDLAPGERRAAVVFCVGFSLVKEVWLVENARRLREAGYVTLNLDYRTFGESGPAEGPRCRLVPPMQVEDVRSALTYLETLPEVDPGKIGVVGVSLGASVATHVAGVDARVRAGVAVAGPGDLERVWGAFPDFERFKQKVHAARQRFVATGEATYVSVPRLLASDPETCALLVEEQRRHPSWRLEITFESLADLLAWKPEAHCPTIRGAMMWIYPADDALVSRYEVQSMYAKAPEPRALVALEGTRHAEIYGTGKGVEPIVRHTREWFARHLPAR